MDTTTTCPACRALAPAGVQCNRHRREAPNARTLRHRRILDHMREQGCEAATAERALGISGRHLTISGEGIGR